MPVVKYKKEPRPLRWRENGDGSWTLLFINRSVATVWANGVWSTWDEHGVGGWNATGKNPTTGKDSVVWAKHDALAAAVLQGFAPLLEGTEQ